MNSANSIDLSDAPSVDICFYLFSIFKGSSFYFEDYDTKLLIQTFIYLGIDFDKFKEVLTSFEFIEIALSSPSLWLPNENSLFSFILQKINENPINLNLINYIFLGACNRVSVNSLISSVQFKEIILNNFVQIQNQFFLNYLATNDFADCQFDFSSLISIFKENQALEKNEMFLIPIDLHCFDHLLIIEDEHSSVLQFNKDQKNLIKKFKQIFIANSKMNFAIHHEILLTEPENVLIIFIPNTITTLSDKCFCGNNLLQQIHLAESITQLGKECFYNCTSLKKINLKNILFLDKWCFEKCFQIEKINLPHALLKLPEYCFSRCQNLKYINIENLEELGHSCFSGCDSLNQKIVDKTFIQF